MDFGDRVNWLVELSSPVAFKSAKDEFVKYNMDVYARIVDEERGIIKGESRNPKTGEFEEYKVSFDQHILTHIQPYLDNPVPQILGPIPEEETKAQLEKWLKKLAIAKSFINEKSFYSDFPRYVSSLSRTISTLKILKQSYKAPYSRRKFKEEKAQGLEIYLDIIQEAGSHKVAISQLQERHPKFMWQHNHELFYTHAEGINKKRVSMALEQIAKLKWPNDYPSAETIRKALLK